jgi:hypothetical protein
MVLAHVNDNPASDRAGLHFMEHLRQRMHLTQLIVWFHCTPDCHPQTLIHILAGADFAP